MNKRDAERIIKFCKVIMRFSKQGKVKLGMKYDVEDLEWRFSAFMVNKEGKIKQCFMGIDEIG